MAGEVTEVRGRAMASEVHAILVDAAPGAPAYLQARLGELDRRWSRFNPDSELSRAMVAAGSRVAVSADTLTLLAAMLAAHDDTGGRYDPTMLRQVVDAGYAASIEDGARHSITVDLPDPSRRLHEIRVDAAGGSVSFPPGLGVDPGGIGKGLAADLVVAELLDAGTAGALVSVGGDLFAAGTPPTDDGWRVQVEDPFDDTATVVEVVLDGGGVATSSTRSRRWSHRGSTAHHVLDPATGTVARTDLATVTAMAGTGWQAEAHATAALLGGRRGAVATLVAAGCSGVVVDLEGGVQLTADLAGAPVRGAAA